MFNNKELLRKTFVLLFFLSLILFSGCILNSESPILYPGENWQRSTPEAQGMDSSILLSALQLLDLKKSGIDSMVIIRNGFIVAEYYRQPFTNETRHRINSATKSFTSTLIGIAIDKELITGVDEFVRPFFPEYSHDDSRVSNITIENLLTMTSGFKWNTDVPLFDPRQDDVARQRTDNWLKYLFSKPMAENPGERFNYNSMNSQLLADILHRVTGGQSIDFAENNLLKPLGIDSWAWRKSPEGSFDGGTSLVMSTEDLARLGYLYLNEGIWDGNRIVSKKWIKDSVKPHTQIYQNGRRRNEYYGYQWWVKDENSYYAKGGVGQYCFVDKEHHLVIACNSSLEVSSSQHKRIESFMEKDIQRSIISENELPTIPETEKKLNDYLALASESNPIGPFSEITKFIAALNNKRIIFEDNDLGLRSVILTFEGSDELIEHSEYIQATGDLATMKVSLRYNGEYSRVPLNVMYDNYYGNCNSEIVSRVLSITEKSLRFESIIPGIMKLWLTWDIEIDGDTIWYRRYILKHDAWQSECTIAKGKVVN